MKKMSLNVPVSTLMQTLMLMLILTLVLGIGTAAPAFAETNAGGDTVSVSYIDAKGDAKPEQQCRKIVSSNTIMGDDWYAATEDTSFNNGMIVYGNANLILCDGVTMTCNDGIWVQENASLTIWAQSTGDNKGKLDTTARTPEKAAIGAIWDDKSGDIVINGGNILAKGGEEAAGIGGAEGSDGGFKTITVNGGKIEAYGGSKGGAGIGGGIDNESMGTIIFNGGRVDAYGHDTSGNGKGTGIGVGYDCKNGVTIEINGGEETNGTGGEGHVGIGGKNSKLTVTGGTVNGSGKGYGAGIGGANSEVIVKDGKVTAVGGEKGGAGIGSNGDGANAASSFTINGGQVEAYGGRRDGENNGGAGIGAGYGSNAADFTVNISGGKTKAVGGSGAAGIGGGAEGGFNSGGEGADVTITGGELLTGAGNFGAHSIGRGGTDHNSGTLFIGDMMCVQGCGHEYRILEDYARWGSITTDERYSVCQGGYNNVYFMECEHNLSSYTQEEDGHTKVCPQCNTKFDKESHEIDNSGKCSVCNFQGPTVTVSFNAGYDNPTGTMESVPAAPDAFYPLPECKFDPPADKVFEGWTIKGVNDIDPSTVYPYGCTILLSGNDVTLTAKWADPKCTVSFDKGEGEGTMQPVPVSIGSEYPLPNSAFDEPVGKRFAGWRVSSGPAEGAEGTVGNTMTISADTTLTAIYKVDEWRNLQAALDEARNGSTVKASDYDLDEDGQIIAWKDDAPLNIGSGKNITLDLDDTAINRSLNGEAEQINGNVITVNGSLTVNDNGEAGTGMITGGKNMGHGGGVILDSDRGTFTFNGGTISGNVVNVKNNTCSGGGVYVANGTLTLSGGAIEENTSGGPGGGVFLESGGTLNISGASVVTGNTWAADKDRKNNIYLLANQKINVIGKLTNTEKIGVSQNSDPGVFTTGYKSAMGEAAPRDYFASDNTAFAVGLTEDGEARLGKEVRVTFDSAGGSAVKPQSLVEGEKAVRPADPTREGYSCKGWFAVVDEEAGTVADTEFDFEGTPIEKSMTLKASWEEKPLPPEPQSIENAQVVLSASSFVYNGKVQKPSVKTIGGMALTEGTDFAVAWSNKASAGVGAYKVTITGKGDYTGTTTAGYKIIPKRAGVSKAVPGKKLVKVTMSSKVAATGGAVYQIQYRVKGKAKWKTTITKAKTKKIKKLKKGKKYQVRVRAYKSVGGTKYYGAWSKVKTTKKVK